MITDYKLFIYEDIDYSIRKDYRKQVEDKSDWLSITDDIYNQVEEEGWIDDLEYMYGDINKEDIKYKELKITKKDKEGLINFDEDIVDDFNEFDIEIKETQKYPYKIIDFIDYENGKVYILKYKENND